MRVFWLQKNKKRSHFEQYLSKRVVVFDPSKFFKVFLIVMNEHKMLINLFKENVLKSCGIFACLLLLSLDAS
jgi:hypothetical protein